MTRIRAALPPGLVCTRRTPEFTAKSVPNALLEAHRTSAGIWGLLRVVRGSVRYCLDADPRASLVMQDGGTAVIEPEELHHIELLDPDTAFFIEFHRTKERA